jgi:hypothetical protein
MAWGMIYDRLPDILEGLINLATGVRVRDPVSGEVYVEPPNFKAGAYLADRVLGKPVAQTKDLTKERAIDSFEEAVKKWAKERESVGPGYATPPLPPPTVDGEVREIVEGSEILLEDSSSHSPKASPADEEERSDARRRLFGE